MSKKILLLGAIAAIFAGSAGAQSVSIPYSGQAPYGGSVAVTSKISGLPAGCVAGAPTYSAGTITTPVTCGTPPPPGKCTVSVSPSGGTDNASWLSKANAAIAAKTCLEVKAGNYKLSQAFTPPAGADFEFDDGVNVNDVAGYSATQPMVLINTANVTFNAVGPLHNVTFTMPITYAINAKNQANLQYNHCFLTQKGAANVTISFLTLFECGGDGVTLQNTVGGLINGNSISKTIRQGVAVTGPLSAVTISNNLFQNEWFTGVDVEPNNPNESIVGLTLTNNTSENNPGGGVSFGVYNLTTAAQVQIVINGHQSINDNQYSLFFNNGNYGNTPSGSIVVNNFTSTGAGYGCAYGRYAATGPHVTINGIVCKNSNRNGTDPHYAMNSAVGVELTGGQGGPSGGIDFFIQTISNNTGKMVNYFQNSNQGGASINTVFKVLPGGSVSGATNPNAKTVYP